MTQTSFYGDTPNFATDYPTQNDGAPTTGNTPAPSSFYPNGGGYVPLAVADDVLAEAQALAAQADTDAANAATSATNAATSATNAATSAANAAAAVQAAAGTATPIVNGTAAVGTGTKWAHEDHVHPTDTSRADAAATTSALALKAPLASPALTGTPTAPTATAGTNTTQLATTAFTGAAVAAEAALRASADALLAPLASPALTGAPTAPTPTTGDNSTKIATTAFVLANPTSRTGTPIDSSTAVLAAWTTIGTAGGIPIDDTPPQNTEGTQVIQATITPKATTNKLRCRFSCSIVVATGDNPTFALFATGSTDAKVARYYSTSAGFAQYASLECEFVPGVTTPITVSVRASMVAGNGYINGNSASRVFGGSQQAVLIVEEIAE